MHYLLYLTEHFWIVNHRYCVDKTLYTFYYNFSECCNNAKDIIQVFPDRLDSVSGLGTVSSENPECILLFYQ